MRCSDSDTENRSDLRKQVLDKFHKLYYSNMCYMYLIAHGKGVLLMKKLLAILLCAALLPAVPVAADENAETEAMELRQDLKGR